MRLLMVGMAAAFAALSACAVVNVDKQMLDGRTAMLAVNGNGFSSQIDIVRATFKEAATLTQAKGFDYFAITQSRDTTSAGSYTTSGTASTYTTGNVYGGAYGASYNGQTTTTYHPGQTYDIIYPGANVMIRMFKVGEVDAKADGIYSATEVLVQSAPSR